MKSTGLAIFVKTPMLSPIKTRLAEGVGEERALLFYQYSIRILEAKMTKLHQQNRWIHPYWAVAEADGMSVPCWQSLPRIFQGEGTLGDRLDFVYSQLLDKHSSAILIGADCPQISRSTLRSSAKKLFGESSGPDFLFGLARDGGFYLFGGRKKIPARVWQSISYSTSSTAISLRERLENLGRVVSLNKVLTDVDRRDDLRALLGELTSKEDLAETEDLKEWLENILIESPREMSSIKGREQ